MKKWIEKIVLTGNQVSLIPLTRAHEQALSEAAADGKLWTLYYTSVPEKEQTTSYIQTALEQYENNEAVPFVVLDHTSNKIVGTTRFLNLDPIHKRVEIGYTWYAKSAQRSGVNRECKYLLLGYAFEKLNCIAVEFRTHAHNKASREAIAKLGAKQDGILRRHQIDRSGGYRDSVVFSIINTEWPIVKKNLEEKRKQYLI